MAERRIRDYIKDRRMAAFRPGRGRVPSFERWVPSRWRRRSGVGVPGGEHGAAGLEPDVLKGGPRGKWGCCAKLTELEKSVLFLDVSERRSLGRQRVDQRVVGGARGQRRHHAAPWLPHHPPQRLARGRAPPLAHHRARGGRGADARPHGRPPRRTSASTPRPTSSSITTPPAPSPTSSPSTARTST